jgi:hypothetical protein
MRSLKNWQQRCEAVFFILIIPLFFVVLRFSVMFGLWVCVPCIFRIASIAIAFTIVPEGVVA